MNSVSDMFEEVCPLRAAVECPAVCFWCPVCSFIEFTWLCEPKHARLLSSSVGIRTHDPEEKRRGLNLSRVAQPWREKYVIACS